MAEIIIKSGESFSGDANQRYPEGQILNVKGFYDQNSHVMTEGELKEYRKVFADDREDSWCEYVPASYQKDKPAPVVFSRHGGGQSGWGQCYATSWNYIADREGLIVVYPDMVFEHTPGGNTEKFGEKIEHEILFIGGLIEELKGKYNVDESRIYMQGMSMGNLMTTNYSRYSGVKLAGAGECAGPSPIQAMWTEDGQIKEYTAAVPIFQSRGENDDMAINGGYDGKAVRNDINRANKKFWLTVNQCDALPEISIKGENNFEFYTGGLADVIYRDVKNRGHGQTFDDAEFVWSLLFSGVSRNADGSVVKSEPRMKPEGDSNAAALADGCKKVYIDNRIVELEAAVYKVHEELNSEHFGHKDLGEVFYAPASVFPAIFGVTLRELGDDRLEMVTPDGRTIVASVGNVGLTVDNTVVSMSRQAEKKGDTIYLPVCWFANNLFGKFTTSMNGSLYIADHYGQMTKDMAVTIKEILS